MSSTQNLGTTRASAGSRAVRPATHGGHDATLREQRLELMTSRDLIAMIPVNRVTARRNDWNMPFPALGQCLQETTEGRILDGELGVAGTGTGERWDHFLTAAVVQETWIDYMIQW